MSKSIFSDIAKIEHEGPDTQNPLAFRYYDPTRSVLGKALAEHLRVAVCYWHTFCWPGADMFGDPVIDRPWFSEPNEMEAARLKARTAFEFFEKIGAPFFCFHDRDVAPEADSFAATCKNIDEIVELFESEMGRTGVQLLWGTANLFSHPRYAAGAATNPDPEVFAYAAAQVKHMLDVTHRLGGANYVLWGGREGYDTLLNTDLRRESDQLGRFLSMVAEYKHAIGFTGTLLIEPKPHEPTKHQYDYDSASVHAFLQKHGLQDEFKLNIEVNHATLAGHSFQHELAYAAANDMLGSVDINRGDPQLGWDTDQFPNDLQEVTLALYTILQAGGLSNGGFNFDAKLRRQSIDPVDLFHAHIGGMDTLARGLLNAAALTEDGVLEQFTGDRYAKWDREPGKSILAGDRTLADMAAYVMDEDIRPKPVSGRQEMLENRVNRYL